MERSSHVLLYHYHELESHSLLEKQRSTPTHPPKPPSVGSRLIVRDLTTEGGQNWPQTGRRLPPTPSKRCFSILVAPVVPCKSIMRIELAENFNFPVCLPSHIAPPPSPETCSRRIGRSHVNDMQHYSTLSITHIFKSRHGGHQTKYALLLNDDHSAISYNQSYP